MPTKSELKINKKFFARIKALKVAGKTKDECTALIGTAVAAAAKDGQWRRSEHVMALSEWTLAINRVYGQEGKV